MIVPNEAIFEFTTLVHNLMINSKDVPNKNKIVFNEHAEKVMIGSNDKWFIWSDYYETWDECDTPKLWYEIPMFDVERCKLEKMSKEELIEMILKTPTAYIGE